MDTSRTINRRDDMMRAGDVSIAERVTILETQVKQLRATEHKNCHVLLGTSPPCSHTAIGQMLVPYVVSRVAIDGSKQNRVHLIQHGDWNVGTRVMTCRGFEIGPIERGMGGLYKFKGDLYTWLSDHRIYTNSDADKYMRVLDCMVTSNDNLLCDDIIALVPQHWHNKYVSANE